MAQQEIGLKLKADTTEAMKSVKELERSVNGLESVKRKGDNSNGFLSENDVKNFRRMSEQAETVYKNFLNRYSTMQREFEKRKGELLRQIETGSSHTEVNAARSELRRIESQSTLLETQARAAENLRNRQTSSQSDISNMRQENGGTMLMGGLTRGAMSALAGTLAVSHLFGLAKQGMGMVKSEEEYMAQLGNRMGGYGGDYTQARKDAMDTGMVNGYKAQETMMLTDEFTNMAGTRSKEKTWNDIQDIQTSSRAMGVDSSTLANAGGFLNKVGALQDGDQRKFANLLAGAIKKEGMEGRDTELIEAVNSMAVNSASNQVNLSKSQLDQLVGFQTMLGSKEEGWKGQRGADIATSIDQGIKGGDNRVDMLLGWGSEYQGVSGRAELERMKAKGITDPENVSKIFSNLDKVAGGNKDYQALMVSDMFGVSIDQADRLLEPDIMESLKKGGMSKKEIDALLKSGDSTVDKKAEEYQGSKAASRARTDAQWEETKKSGGEFLDNLWRPAAEFFTGLDPTTQWGAMGMGAAGATVGGSKALGLLKNKFPQFFGSTVGEAGAGAAASAGGSAASAGLGATVKKFLGPVGTLTSISALGDMVDGFGDWLFGHKKGDEKQRGILDPRGLNPWDKKEKYKDSRQGFLPWLFGNDSQIADEEDDKTKAKKTSNTKKDDEQKSKSKEMIELEAKNLDKKESLLNTEAKLKEKEANNVKQLKAESADYKNNASLKGEKEDKGFFGNLWDGIKNWFGFGDDSGSGMTQTSYGGGSKATGSNAALRNQNLKAGGSTMTAAQVNRWIDSKAPKGSILRGQGAAFVKAAEESGLDVKYLVAHAAHETAWGTSNIAKKKGNFYGIGAFDNSPMASAYKYGGTSEGIIEGAKWIAKNYVNKGQNTLNKMRHNNGVHEYATDPDWDKKIANIMAGAPTGTLNVKVSGGITGLSAENNAKVTSALTTTIKNSKLAKNTTQGNGGWL
ncbi:glucosaminidase domain-containing protein [Bacillus subtilis]|uniref:N-acetylglucosaminidase n=1 Tax=Bacillus subtilis TaxID=1423 RepID=UPI003CE7ECCE